MTRMLYEVEHRVRTLRAQLDSANDALLAYIHGDGTDPDVFDRLDREIARLREQLDTAEEHATHLRMET